MTKQPCPDCGATVSPHNMLSHRGSLACKRMAHETRKTTPVPMKDVVTAAVVAQLYFRG